MYSYEQCHILRALLAVQGSRYMHEYVLEQVRVTVMKPCTPRRRDRKLFSTIQRPDGSLFRERQCSWGLFSASRPTSPTETSLSRSSTTYTAVLPHARPTGTRAGRQAEAPRPPPKPRAFTQSQTRVQAYPTPPPQQPASGETAAAEPTLRRIRGQAKDVKLASVGP